LGEDREEEKLRRKMRWEERIRIGGRRRGRTHKGHAALRESEGCERRRPPEEIDHFPFL
jgi:hypothetical protein